MVIKLILLIWEHTVDKLEPFVDKLHPKMASRIKVDSLLIPLDRFFVTTITAFFLFSASLGKPLNSF
jgi:hypothetical protein